jgi:hypothetical protein
VIAPSAKSPLLSHMQALCHDGFFSTLKTLTLIGMFSAAQALQPFLGQWRQQWRPRERLALCTCASPFAVAQSFSPRVFDDTLAAKHIEATLERLSRVTITVPADVRLTDFVLAAANVEQQSSQVAVSFVRSSEGLRLVAYGSQRALQSIVQAIRLHSKEGISITWQLAAAGRGA